MGTKVKTESKTINAKSRTKTKSTSKKLNPDVTKPRDLKAVQDHYMDYPYPSRNPEEEKQRLVQTTGEYLGEINHWLFNGKQDFTKDFRVLIAGGGTGDSAIYLAQQLAHTNAEIVYLDFSKNSMKVAQERAKIRGLKNITWINDSILELPNLKIGKFDFINSTGVLHHLESPPAGLAALNSVLKDTGAMNLMVYAKYGRTGVYQVQEIMRLINENVTTRPEEVANGNIIVNSLPNSNWYMRGQELLADHKLFGDVGLYDMFLHKQDRCYDIPELYDWIETEGLKIVQFTSLMDRIRLKIENYVRDPALLAKIKKMPIQKQQAISEIIYGSIIKHTFYVAKQPAEKIEASFDDLDNIPQFYLATNIPNSIVEMIENKQAVPGTIVNLTLNTALVKDLNVPLHITEYTKHIFKSISQGDNTLRKIMNDIKKSCPNKKLTDKNLIAEIKNALSSFKEAGAILLRHKSIAQFNTFMNQ